MKRRVPIPLPQFLAPTILLFWAVTLFAQLPDHYQITPDRTTMLIGESRPFRMVDQNGRAQHKVTWTISDADAFQSFEGDQLQLTAKRAGDFRLTARTDFATAEATVKVVEGQALPAGTVKWAAGKKEGCTTIKVIPARPAANGPYLYQQTQCEDGEYVAAYTADGVQLWRRKIGNGAAPVGPGGNDYEVAGNRLEPNSSSICDSLALGTDQPKIREVLTEHNLSFREESTGGRVWLVEESNMQCKLSFDEKSVLVKKRKVFVTQ